MKMRDQAMLMRRLQGDSIKQIQERFQCSKATADRALMRARKANYIQTGQDLILTEILPSAIIAVKGAIEHGDMELAANTALKVLEGVGVMGKNVQIAPEKGEVVDEFMAFRRRIINKIDEEADQGTVIDAEATIDHGTEQPSPAGRIEDGRRDLQGHLPFLSTTDADRGSILSDRFSPDAEEGAGLHDVGDA